MDEEERDITDLLKRYEQMLESGAAMYFDTEEFADLAAYYDMLEEVDTAKEIVEAGLKIHPGSQSLLLLKARFMTYDGLYQETLDYLNKTFDGYDVELYLLKIDCQLQLELHEQAALLAEELLSDEELDEEAILSELGFLYLDADYFDAAISLLEQSLALNPENIDVLTELSYAYEMCDDFDKAIEASDKVLDLDPYAYDAWINLGKYYTMQYRYEKAVDAFDFALAISDENTDVLKLKAHCLSLCGKMDEAIALFQECISSNKSDETLYYALVDCYFSMERYDDMLQCLNKYEELHGKSPEIFAKKALAWLQKNNLEKAYSSLMSGMEIDPESGDLSIVTGEFYFRLGEYNNAEFFFLQAYEKDSNDVIMIDRLSLISIAKGDVEKAIEYTEKLAAIDTGYLIKMRLVLLYFEVNDKQKFNQCLSTFDDDELKSLVSLFFSEEKRMLPSATRETLINRLNDARDRRQLFKNSVY